MATSCNVENDNNKGHEAWVDTPDVEVECKIRLSNPSLADIETKLNHVPQGKRIPLFELLLSISQYFQMSVTGPMYSCIMLMFTMIVWLNSINIM